MELSDIDLNQLVLFQQLMVERRVSRVAENLGLTQPAVSNTLAKLRRQFGDDLFVRTPTGMMPTPFAEQLAEPDRLRARHDPQRPQPGTAASNLPA